MLSCQKSLSLSDLQWQWAGAGYANRPKLGSTIEAQARGLAQQPLSIVDVLFHFQISKVAQLERMRLKGSARHFLALCSSEADAAYPCAEQNHFRSPNRFGRGAFSAIFAVARGKLSEFCAEYGL